MLRHCWESSLFRRLTTCRGGARAYRRMTTPARPQRIQIERQRRWLKATFLYYASMKYISQRSVPGRLDPSIRPFSPSAEPRDAAHQRRAMPLVRTAQCVRSMHAFANAALPASHAPRTISISFTLFYYYYFHNIILLHEERRSRGAAACGSRQH